jgi:hypothetical protein
VQAHQPTPHKPTSLRPSSSVRGSIVNDVLDVTCSGVCISLTLHLVTCFAHAHTCQAGFRRHRDRAQFTRSVASVTLIAARWRGYAARRARRQRRLATLCIQRAWAAYVASQTASLYSLAATLVQARVRGVVARARARRARRGAVGLQARARTRTQQRAYQ